jgi:hypothetical protein
MLSDVISAVTEFVVRVLLLARAIGIRNVAGFKALPYMRTDNMFTSCARASTILYQCFHE